MRRDFSRTDRVGQQIQKEISLILQREIKDPRLGMVTVSGVDVSRDLAFAKVYVTMFEADETKVKTSMKILDEASGAVRSMLARRIKARTIPELTFKLDTSLMDGMRISNLVDQVVAKDKALRDEAGDNDSEGETE